jgi:gliding motility-associatede transport system auxiliary component
VRALEPTLTSIDADLDVLVLIHPKNLPAPALYAIDQYALRGGHVLVFVDPRAEADPSAAADPNNPMAQMQADRSSDLQPLFKAWGIDYKSDQVVADLEHGLEVSMRQNEPPSQHIAILGLNHEGMAKDVITGQIDSVNFATAGSLKAVSTPGLTFEPLVHTGAKAGLLPAQRFAMLADPATLKDGFAPTGEFVVAARVTGKAKSAFAEGPPAGVSASPTALKESAQPLNVVVVADTDLLTDFMWVQQANFFGQTVFQPFANNGDLVVNAIDNLGGSSDLISIRARAAYSRPFTRVEELKRNADAQLRGKEQQLQQQLQQTEEKLNQLQSAQPKGNEAILTPEMAQAIDNFQKQKTQIRKDLRETRAGLDKDIRALGWKLKLINILLMPALIVVLGLLVFSWRKRRRNAIAMLKRSAA